MGKIIANFKNKSISACIYKQQPCSTSYFVGVQKERSQGMLEFPNSQGVLKSLKGYKIIYG